MTKIPFQLSLSHGLEANMTDSIQYTQQPRIHSFLSPVIKKEAVNTFEVVYFGDPPSQFQSVFNTAVNIWSELLLDITVPIVVHAHWTPISNEYVLGAAGPLYLYLYEDRFYSDAQINQLTGIDQSPDEEDIIMYINSDFIGTWYFGDLTSDNTPSGQHDLLTVILHELGHGLGIVGLITDSGYSGDKTHIYIYDSMLLDDYNNYIINEQTIVNNDLLLNTLRNTNNIYFKNTATLYHPATFNAGSSMYHLDEHTYIAGNINALMSPQLNAGERILTPGPITIEIMSAMGWNTRDCTEYSSNCQVCLDACCSWCESTQRCFDPAFHSCSNSNVDQCTQCLTDNDCNDLNDFCTSGQCLSGQCVYTNIDCNDNDECTRDECYSNVGCVHIEECEQDEQLCNSGMQYITGSTYEFGEVDNQKIERFISFSSDYNGWIIKDVTVSLLFDKVDGSSCDHKSTGAAWPNELYIHLKTPDSAIIKLIDIDTYSNIHGLHEDNGPFLVSFNDNAELRVVSKVPKNGTYIPIEHMNNHIVDTVLNHKSWRIEFGDAAKNDPACFYNAQIQLLVKQPESIVPDTVLCKGDINTMTIDELELQLHIPAHFFELDSMEVDISIDFSACSDDNVKVKRIVDRRLDSDIVSIPIEVVSVDFCAVYEEWDVQIMLNSMGEVNSGDLIFNQLDHSFGLSAQVDASVVFHKKNNVNRELRNDTPPGYTPILIKLNKI